jgi:hypothetical protein
LTTPTAAAVVVVLGFGAVSVVVAAGVVKIARPMAGPLLGLVVTGMPTAGGTATVVFGLGAAFSVVCATAVLFFTAVIGGTDIDIGRPFVL